MKYLSKWQYPNHQFSKFIDNLNATFSLHFKTYGILTVRTFESARVLFISGHMSFLQLVDIESATSEAMIDKTLIGYNLCHLKNSLPSVLI